MALGLGFGLGLQVGKARDPFAPRAPVLDLASSSDAGSSSTDNLTNDTTPTFNFAFDDLLENDIIRVRDNGVEVDAHTVTALEAAGDNIDLDLSALSAGVHAISARRETGGHIGDWGSLTITIETTAPTITSATTANNAENSVLAHSLTANETVTWSIVGGADQARFELSGSTLRWASNGTKDYEAPNDADTNNTYVVQVRATDTAGNTTNQTITVTVTDVAEGGLPVFDAASNTTGANTGSISWTHTPVGTPTGVVVGVSYWQPTLGALASATYGGQAMSVEDSADAFGDRIMLFSLANPPSGARTVAITFSAADAYPAAGAITVTGGSTSDVLGTTAKASGATNAETSISADVSSAVGKLVVDVMGARQAPTVGAGQTDRVNVNASGLRVGMSTEAGAATVTMSWTFSSSNTSIIGASFN